MSDDGTGEDEGQLGGTTPKGGQISKRKKGAPKTSIEERCRLLLIVYLHGTYLARLKGRLHGNGQTVADIFGEIAAEFNDSNAAISSKFRHIHDPTTANKAKIHARAPSKLQVLLFELVN